MDYSVYFQYNMEIVEGLQKVSELCDDPVSQFFQERFSLNDLDKNAISNLTAYHKGQRMTNPDFSSGMSVIEAQWSPTSNTFTTFFEMEPTKGTPTMIMTPNAKEYQGSFYNVVIQFLDPNKYFGTKEEFSAKSTSDQVNVIKDMIWKSEVKVHSNDPSFYYQGMWEDLANLDGVVLPFPGPKGDGVWRQRHKASGGLTVAEVRITKHMAQVIGNLNNMLSEIRDKTRVIA